MADSSQSNKPTKAFVPLENNPEVMTRLVHELGIPSTLGFTDVFSIDDESLLAFVPRPSYALLLVFPVSVTYEAARIVEDGYLHEYTGSGASEPVMWFKQTITNACGLIGLLHAVSNSEPRKQVLPDSGLAKLLKDAEPLAPQQRADLLYDSEVLENAHADAAKRGDTEAPPAQSKVELHFVCFVKGNDGHLWELDGRRKGPLDRGALGEDDDMLSQKALEAGVKRFVELEKSGNKGEMRFSLLSLGPID